MGSFSHSKIKKKLKRCQKRVLSIILRKRVDRFNYVEVLSKLELESLEVRRDNALKKFGRKLFLSNRFRYFLPSLIDIDSTRTLRNRSRIMTLPKFKHDRLKKLYHSLCG